VCYGRPRRARGAPNASAGTNSEKYSWVLVNVPASTEAWVRLGKDIKTCAKT